MGIQTDATRTEPLAVGTAEASDARDTGFFGWWRVASTTSRRALIAASLGWALDAFDVMLLSLVLASVIGDLGLTKAQAGALSSVTLLAAAAGGLIFGHVADRFGRTRAMIASVLLYSIFTAACGLSQNLWQFVVFRALLGLGMGGEWASGAALVSETWPTKQRGRALGFMQSSWAIGFAAAALVAGFVLRDGDGARCSSSGYCRRCSRSGFAETSMNRRSGRPAGLRVPWGAPPRRVIDSPTYFGARRSA
jgi:hypothetical protein